MELKTILNRVYQLPGFVYGRIRLVRAAQEGERDRIEVEVRPRANGRALCSGCGHRTGRGVAIRMVGGVVGVLAGGFGGN